MSDTMMGFEFTRDTMDEQALKLVKGYANNHLDKSDNVEYSDFDCFIVWKSKILQNWKYLISTTLLDGMYYELTYNGDKHEWYLDAYKKFDNKCIKDYPMRERWTDMASTEKPPIGLEPRVIHDRKRITDIVDAMERYSEAGMRIPAEWVDELHDLVDRSL